MIGGEQPSGPHEQATFSGRPKPSTETTAFPGLEPPVEYHAHELPAAPDKDWVPFPGLEQPKEYHDQVPASPDKNLVPFPGLEVAPPTQEASGERKGWLKRIRMKMGMDAVKPVVRVMSQSEIAAAFPGLEDPNYGYTDPGVVNRGGSVAFPGLEGPVQAPAPYTKKR